MLALLGAAFDTIIAETAYFDYGRVSIRRQLVGMVQGLQLGRNIFMPIRGDRRHS